MTGPRRVAIHYQRLPHGLRIYDQRVVEESEEVVVTLSEPIDGAEPMIVGGDVILEPGSLVVWFTFPGAWHDIGRFHRADGRFTGLYANILTPPRMEPGVWHTTDLCLDVWWPSGGRPTLLDEHEFEAVLASGRLDERTADRALAEARRLMALARERAWPPPIVAEWTLARALEAVGELRPADRGGATRR